MDSFLICSVLLFFMFTGSQSASFSKSCSWVNGKESCTSDQSNGNMAMSSSQAGSGGPNGPYQSNSAMTGNSRTGDFRNVAMQSGNPPEGGMPMMPPMGMPMMQPMGMPMMSPMGMAMPGGGGGRAMTGAYAGNMAPGGGFNPMQFVQGFMMGRR